MNNPYTFRQIDGISLDNFQPPRSKQKEILVPMVLNLKKEEFEMKNKTSFRQDGTNLDDTSSDGRANTHASDQQNLSCGSSAIRADSEEGVFGF